MQQINPEVIKKEDVLNIIEEAKNKEIKAEDLAKRKDRRFYYDDPRKIYVDLNKNHRIIYFDSPEEKQDIKDSIKFNGVLDPIRVRKIKDKDSKYEYELTHGNRRMILVTELIAEGVDIKRIPMIIEDKTDQQIILDHITLNSGKPFTKLELAGIYTKLQKMGWDINEIVKETGKSYQTVANLIALQTKTSMEVKKAVKSGKLSTTAAMEFTSGSIKNTDKQDELLKELLEKSNGEKVKIKDVQEKIKPKKEKVIEMINNDEIDTVIISLEEIFTSAEEIYTTIKNQTNDKKLINTIKPLEKMFDNKMKAKDFIRSLQSYGLNITKI